MDINLTGLNKIDYTLAFDDETGEMVLTFLDPAAPETPLGTITIETSKYRALMESLGTVATEVPEQTIMTEFDQKSFYRVNQSKVEMQFT